MVKGINHLRMPFDPLTLGRNIHARREQLGISQRDLAIKCAVTQATISFWEHGTAIPGLMRLGLIADALDTTVADLLTEDRPHNGDDRAVA